MNNSIKYSPCRFSVFCVIFFREQNRCLTENYYSFNLFWKGIDDCTFLADFLAKRVSRLAFLHSSDTEIHLRRKG